MAILKCRSAKTIAGVIFAFGLVVIDIVLIAPIFSTRPSKSAVDHWEANYSAVLPPGYSDFRGHWQSQDIGVHIFSFRYADGLGCEDVLSRLVDRLNKDYHVQDRVPNEVGLRRAVTYSDPRGFDEFRFVCVPATHRVYAMFANLDDEMEAHHELVEQLHKIASGSQ